MRRQKADAHWNSWAGEAAHARWHQPGVDRTARDPQLSASLGVMEIKKNNEYPDFVTRPGSIGFP